MSDETETLTTIMVTPKERRMIARGLSISATLVDAVGNDSREILSLWERIEAGGE